ncbi:PH domain-containing protein [Amycolatopsis minnesotensis]|uniref:PH domain-containing protein n=1 Tax=Amycolatopsis minnesotensis TaxID=337894 RepID=A0ABP5DKE2_9PSEU
MSEPLELVPPRHRVPSRAMRWWTVRAAITDVVLLAVVAGCAVWLRGVLPGALLTAIAVVAVLTAAAYLVLMPRVRYRVHRWEVTADAVYTSSGWVWQEWRVAPLSRVQTVDTERGPLQQLFGLATVTVTTASSAGAVKIAGLSHEVAKDVVRTLTAVTQSTPGDAT